LDCWLGFFEQVDGLQDQVTAMEQRVRSAALADGGDPQRLQEAKERLLSLCGVRRQELASFAAGISHQAQASEQWTNLAGIRFRCQSLAADCMALEQRLALSPDYRPAAIAADRLAEEFSSKTGEPRYHYAVISDAEHYGATVSAIHLSYSRLDLWHLNRAVHEFGHLWAEEFASGPTGAQTAFLRDLPASDKQYKPEDSEKAKWTEPQAKEFYADIVATFLTGPAYGYSCLLLDFSPADRLRSDTHPSDDERACCILAVLRELAKDFRSVTRPQVMLQIDRLGTYWNQARSAAGAAEPLATRLPIESAVLSAINRLKAEIPNARYGSLALANRVLAEIAANSTAPPAGAAGSDILNAGWMRRLERPYETFEIGVAALEMIASLPGK
jgi:hypothetical protein